MRRNSGVGVALALSLSAGCRSQSGPADRILLVTIDTLRADHLGYAGHDVETPNLDTLARDGSVFTQAVTAAPLTLPSHSTILSGLYPTRHQTRNNGTFRLPEEVETVAESLRGRGYATGAFIGAFVLDSRFGLGQGFDHYDDDLPEENPSGAFFYAERRAEEVVGRALKWIAEQKEDERLFVWVHLYDCHAPYDPPSPYRERYSARPYDGEIAYTDFALGPLLQAFAPSRGGATLVTSDHGESLGEHGESTHALFIYDGTMRVPLLLRARGIPPGTRIDAQVRTVDIAPTLLELAGAAPGESDSGDELDGKSLLSYVSGEETASRSAYGESFNSFFNFNWAKLRSVRDGGYKLVDAPRRELYDLEKDPEEKRNLWTEEPPPIARNLLRELARIQASDRGVGGSAEVDPETARRLQSLGYVVSSTPSRQDVVDNASLPDPKDRGEVHERLQALLSPTDLSPDEVIAEYRKVLKLEPQNAWARSHLAHVLADEKRYEDAVTEFRALTEVSTLDARAYQSLGIALLALDRVDEALDVTQKAVESRAWDPGVLVLRGEALERASRPEEALAAYEMAIAAEPEDAENYWRSGAVLQKLGKTAEAEKELRKAVEMRADLEPAKLALARLLTQAGRTDEALRLLEPSAGAKRSSGVKAGLAEIELASGRIDGALRLLEEARAETPDNTRVLALLGPIYAQKGELEKATAILEKAMSLGEKDPEVRRNLALTYLQGGKTSSAIRELQLASRDAPSDPSIWFGLGNAYFRSGNFNGAAVSLEKCLDLDPSREGALFNLALAYEQSGKRQRAVETYGKFLASGVKDERRRAEAGRRMAKLGGSR